MYVDFARVCERVGVARRAFDACARAPSDDTERRAHHGDGAPPPHAHTSTSVLLPRRRPEESASASGGGGGGTSCSACAIITSYAHARRHPSLPPARPSCRFFGVAGIRRWYCYLFHIVFSSSVWCARQFHTNNGPPPFRKTVSVPRVQGVPADKYHSRFRPQPFRSSHRYRKRSCCTAVYLNQHFRPFSLSSPRFGG